MPITRRFLDWSRPALPAVVAAVRERYTVMGHCDLSNVVTVFPGRQAARRFLELLVQSPDATDSDPEPSSNDSPGALVPPEIITVGQLPELLYVPKRPFASALTQRLAWAEALKNLPRERLERVVRHPPAEHDVDAWMALGELLSNQHRELAADLLNFAAVAELGAKLAGFNESPRWKVLAEVQNYYLGILDSYELWDQQTARLVAIDKHECHTDKDLLLVGTVDLPRTLRKMLEQVQDRVTAYVQAPPNLGRRFDAFGCLVPEQWTQVPLDVETAQVQVVEGPADQAEAVVEELARFDGRYAMEDVTVSVPDDRIVPHLRRLLSRHQVPSRWVIARQLPDTEPYRLLLAVADYLESNRTDRFAALVRHPDLSAWIDRQGMPADWLSQWDRNFGEHLQRHTDEILGDYRNARVSGRLVQLVRGLLKPLTIDSRPLSDWAEPLTRFLLRVYEGVPFDLHNPGQRVLVDAFERIHAAFIEHTALPEALTPLVTAAQAIRLTLEEIRDEPLYSHDAGDAVQMSGWLDMPLDDAPAAIITSFNEGIVPASVNHDLFLPNRLRAHLGIEDNARRYARDAYALSVLLHSRERVRLIVAKRDVQGDSLAPSRLLFATDAETVARRVLAFYGDGSVEADETSGEAEGQRGRGEEGTERHGLVIPRPEPLEQPKVRFRVTEFRDYLASPYRYYLRHLLRLQELTDDIDELDAAGFGNLIHAVLKEFGESDAKDATEPAVISEFLRATLDRVIEETYGSDPLYPVLVQAEQALVRLKAFARWQADWRRQGWEIRFAETRQQVAFAYGESEQGPGARGKRGRGGTEATKGNNPQ
jgi:ATP-dependent helicase/nuclease subunit B